MTEKTYQHEDDTDDEDLTTPEVEVEAEMAEPDDPASMPEDEVDEADDEQR